MNVKLNVCYEVVFVAYTEIMTSAVNRRTPTSDDVMNLFGKVSTYTI